MGSTGNSANNATNSVFNSALPNTTNAPSQDELDEATREAGQLFNQSTNSTPQDEDNNSTENAGNLSDAALDDLMQNTTPIRNLFNIKPGTNIEPLPAGVPSLPNYSRGVSQDYLPVVAKYLGISEPLTGKGTGGKATVPLFNEWVKSIYDQVASTSDYFGKMDDLTRPSFSSNANNDSVISTKYQYQRILGILRDYKGILQGEYIYSGKGKKQRRVGHEALSDGVRKWFERDTGLKLSDSEWNAARSQWTQMGNLPPHSSNSDLEKKYPERYKYKGRT